MKKVLFVVCMAALLAGSNGMAASLDVNANAALTGNFGLEVIMDGVADSAFVRDNTPDNETIYRATWQIDWNTLNFATTSGAGSTHAIFKGWDNDQPAGVQRQHLVVGLRYNLAGERRLWAKATDANTGAGHYTEWGLPAGAAGYPAQILVEFDQGNDTLNLCRQNAFAGSQMVCSPITTAEMGSHNIDSAQFGAAGGSDTGTTGSYYLDTFESYRTLAP